MLVFLKRNCSGDLNEESLKLLYISLVRSNLCYASQLWAPQSPTLMLEVENIQRRATRFICKNSELSYKDRLLNLNLLPINYLLEYLDLLFLYKFVYGIILSVDISVDTQSKVGLYIYWMVRVPQTHDPKRSDSLSTLKLPRSHQYNSPYCLPNNSNC